MTKETPVGHGRITCFSVYCGPEMDFGDGKARLWVDVLKGGREVLHAFKPYLENETILKVRREWRAPAALPFPFTQLRSRVAASGLAQLCVRPTRLRKRGHPAARLRRRHHPHGAAVELVAHLQRLLARVADQGRRSHERRHGHRGSERKLVPREAVDEGALCKT